MKINWVKMGTRPCSVLKIEPIARVLDEDLLPIIGCRFSKWLVVPEEEGHMVGIYNSKEELNKLIQTLLNKIKTEKDFDIKHINGCYEACKRMVKICKRIFESNLSKKSNEELKKYFLEYYDSLREYCFFLWAMFNTERNFVEVLRKKLQKSGIDSKKVEKYIETFGTLTKLTDGMKEQVALMRIALKIEKNQGKLNERIENEIKEHMKKYRWIPVYDFIHKSWDRQYFINVLHKIKNPLKKLKEVKDKLRKNQESIQRAIEEIKPNEELKRLIKILQEYTFLRTYRTNALRKAMYYLQPLIEEIGRRANLTKFKAAALTSKEVITFLEDGKLPPIKEIKARSNRYCLIKKNKSWRIITGHEIEKIVKKELDKEIRELKPKIIKGNTACPGIAKGRVKIVKSIKQLSKVKSGDILVATMTTPDMVIAMKKALAIVTDEGGLTSHAAIVSRELKVPCIVGTGNATKVLKDGDLVKVDATRGIVEIIK